MNNPESTPDTLPENSPLSLDKFSNALIEQRYRVIKLIDAGGMASVYRAYDTRLDRDVALKIMHAHLAHNQKIRQRFETEARAAARLLHPGIVQIYDQGIWHGQAYLIMEFVNGPNLRQLLSKHGPLSLEKALLYTKMILTALKVAHNHQLIHRDIKPENVLLCQDGQVKVADFGLAHAVSQATGNTTGTVMGTVTYLAPEIITQEKSDARSDIYAVGAMLYEFLTGTPPHVGKTSIGTAWAHVNQDIADIKTIIDWIPESVNNFISQLCARNPEQRPANAALALDILEKIKLTETELAQVYIRPTDEIIDKHHTIITNFTGNNITRNANQTHLIPSLESAGQKELFSPGDTTTSNPSEIKNLGNEVSFPPLHSFSNNTQSQNGEITETITSQPSDAKILELLDKETAPVAPKRRKYLLLALISLLIVLGGSIAFWFTYGPGNWAKIPNLVGKTVTEAKKNLDSLKLTLKQKEEFSDSVPAGKIISTNPKAGDYVYYNSSVEIKVSRGIKMVKIPNLEKLSLTEAKKALQEADLKVGEITRDYSDEVAENLIVEQSLTAGESIKHGSVVNIVISKGKEPVTLADLKGKKLPEIKTILESLKLVPDIAESYSDTIPAGELIKQNPEAGATVYHGDKIKVEISKGPETITVPNLIGSRMADAKKKLDGLGFKYTVKRSGRGLFPNWVYDQSPAGGTKIKKGSTVTLTYF